MISYMLSSSCFSIGRIQSSAMLHYDIISNVVMLTHTYYCKTAQEIIGGIRSHVVASSKARCLS